MDQSLADINKDLLSGAYKFSDEVKHEAGELSESIKKIHQEVRNKRREITGGYIEDETYRALKVAEEKLEKLIAKLKD